MCQHSRLIFLFLAFGAALVGQSNLTIYNQGFAVVRDVIPLDLKQGLNTIRFSGATAHLEPDSVILRDPGGAAALKIIEQNFRAEPISEALLLSLFEGKEIEFEETGAGGEKRLIRGRIIRSGYVRHSAMDRYGYQYAAYQNAISQGGGAQPIVEMGGKLLFHLPGRPVFPALGDDTILKPTLDWRIHAGRAVKLDAELSYISGGMSWKADYNLVAPEQGDTLDIVGWVTMDNQSGKDFKNVRVKLVAGDVSKMQPGRGAREQVMMARAEVGGGMAPSVTERSFDEYHLYTLPLATDLRDRETKQVEFLRAAKVASRRLYVYDGARIGAQYAGWDPAAIRTQPDYGTESNPKVWVMREFLNNEASGLGIALPKGRARFYRRDQGGQLEFTGENNIDHTPRDEKVRVYTGDAFDIVGERRRTNFQIDSNQRWVDESFEIKLRNHKREAVEVRVVERLYRWSNWRLMNQTPPFTKKDSRTIEFVVKLQPGQEQTVSYTVHYSW
ncbi:MAG: hypothetical protein IANPNBLG_04204 [Bryobacteraceae bacterium]|nr:hypothetical protein [Bryobacteraceae bacterium]